MSLLVSLFLFRPTLVSSAEDRIIISRNERLALIRGSKPIARMTFPDGVPFLPSMDFIAGIPPPTTSSICVGVDLLL